MKISIVKIFISVLIIIFGLQSWGKADDIRDFEIEGMSLGDSLLDHFSEKEIKRSERYDNTNTNWKSDKMFQLRTGKKGPYTEIMFALKKNDKKYKIYAIDGLVKMEYNISECYPKLEKTSKSLEEFFPNAEIRKDHSPHRGDPTGNSMVKSVYFLFPSGDFASVECYDWSKKIGYWDNFRIGLVTEEFNTWNNSNY